jgi:RNase P subunit RPR2
VENRGHRISKKEGDLMQIRCQHCHKPFAIGKAMVHSILDGMEVDNMSHYNATCPHCRKVSRISRSELQHSAPDWHKTEETTQPKS